MCLKEINNNKEQIREELFLKHINPTEVISLLNRQLNNIIENVKKVSVLFSAFENMLLKNKPTA